MSRSAPWLTLIAALPLAIVGIPGEPEMRLEVPSAPDLRPLDRSLVRGFWEDAAGVESIELIEGAWEVDLGDGAVASLIATRASSGRAWESGVLTEASRLVSRDIPILRLEGDSRSTAARAIDAGDVWLAAAVDGRDAPILVLSAPASVADVAARRFDEVLDAVRFEVAPSADQTASTWLRVLLVAGCIAVGSAGAISRRWKVVRARLESSLLSLLPRAGSQRSQPAWDSVS